jgi:type I restriction enzyme R subunit
VLHIAPFTQIGTPMQIVKKFGSRAKFEAAVHELQSTLYQDAG